MGNRVRNCRHSEIDLCVNNPSSCSWCNALYTDAMIFWALEGSCHIDSRQRGGSVGFGMKPISVYTLALVPLCVRSPPSHLWCTVTPPLHLYLCSSMTTILILLVLSSPRRSLGYDLQCRFWLRRPLLIALSQKTNCRRRHRGAGRGTAYWRPENYTPDAPLTHT